MKHILLFGVYLLLTPLAQAAVDSEEYEDYEAIVRNLSGTSRTQVKTPTKELSPLDTSEIHVGVGIANQFANFRMASGQTVYSNQKGFQAALGIDLFSPRWMAEGTARSFANQQSEKAQVQLREFDLKIYNKGRVVGIFGYRAGLGLSGRYLRVIENQRDDSGKLNLIQSDFSTPSSVATLGMDARFNSFLSLAGDLSYRTALVTETVDQNSFDFVIRVDAHF